MTTLDLPRPTPAGGQGAAVPALVAAPQPERRATRSQRLGLLAGLVVAACLALYLFASILLPFVAAAGIAYFLDPPATRLTRAGVSRGVAAVLMIVALLAAGLLFALLLYPLLLAQLGAAGRPARRPMFSAVRHLGRRADHPACRSLPRAGLHRRASCAIWSARQAGSMLSFLRGSRERAWSGAGSRCSTSCPLLVVTPVVAFYLLRDWRRAVARVD